MNDVMRVGGGTFNVPAVRHVYAANFINWVVGIPLPLRVETVQRREVLRRHFGMATEEVNSETVPTPPTPDDVVHHIERTIDHLVQGRTTPDQRRSLGKAVERADRVAPDADRAFGRILGG